MLDRTDPHFGQGYDDAAAGRDPYEFQDTENQRRYNAGFRAACAERRPTQVPPEKVWGMWEPPPKKPWSLQEQLYRLQRLGSTRQ